MSSKSAKISFLIFFGVLSAAFLYMAAPLMKGIFFAIVIAVVFHPVYKFFLKLLRQRRYAAAIVTTVLSFCVVVIPLIIVVTTLASQLFFFATKLAEQLQSGQLAPVVDHIGEIINVWLMKIHGGTEPVFDLRVAIVDFLRLAGKVLYQFSPKVLATTARIGLDIIVLLIFLVVFFAEGSRLFAWLVKASPLTSAHQEEISHDIRVMISAILMGMAATSMAQGALVGIGFWVADFKDAFMWGAIGLLASFIPIVGAASCYIGATIALLALGRSHAAILFFLYGVLIISSVDNIIKPLVMGSHMRVHPVLLFVALLGGVRAFGPVGIIFGPVLLAVFLAALKIYQREFTSDVN